MTATRSPESQKMVEYLTARAEALPAAQVRARFRAAVADFEGALAGVEAAEARAVRLPGEWTIAQVVDHLAQTTIRGADELRHLLEGRRPPAPPVYEGLTSAAAHRAPWEDLTAELAAANAEFDALLGRAVAEAPPPGLTVRTILVTNRTLPDGRLEPEIFDAELTWKGYAMTQRLHLLDHRTQVRRLRERGETRA